MTTKEKKGSIQHTFQVLARLWPYYQSQALLLIPSIVIFASQDFVGNYIFAWFNRYILQVVVSGTGMRGALLGTGIYFLMNISYIVLFAYGLYFVVIGICKICGLVSDAMLHKLLRQQGYMHTGEVMSRMVSDVGQGVEGSIWNMGWLLMDILPIIGFAVCLALIDWRVMLLSMTMGVVYAVVSRRYIPHQHKIGAAVQEQTGVANQKLTDILAGAVTVRLFGLAGNRGQKYREVLEQVQVLENRRVKLDANRRGITGVVVWLGSAGSIALAGWLVAQGEIPLPSMAMVIAFSHHVVIRMGFIFDAMADLQKAVAAAERTIEVLDFPIEDPRLEQPALIVTENPVALAVSHVTFAYNNDRGPALQDISLQVRQGEIVALVGGSGSGKSTLFQVLLNMQMPQEGSVQAWGSDCRQVSLSSWRSQFGYVAQESPLFDATIAENVAFGAGGVHNVSQDDIESAVRRANAYDFIQTFPQGLDTPTGELGGKLSGGQRQRIAIARAFVRDAPILLLDEATSALDSESEEAVQEAIHELMKGHTVLVAAHRLSTVKDAHRILVMEQGRIVEEGDHETLLAKGGAYTRLWAAQEAVVA